MPQTYLVGLPQHKLQTCVLQLQTKPVSRGRMLPARQSLQMAGNGSHTPSKAKSDHQVSRHTASVNILQYPAACLSDVSGVSDVLAPMHEAYHMKEVKHSIGPRNGGRDWGV